jgi:hypothetical protein
MADAEGQRVIHRGVAEGALDAHGLQAAVRGKEAGYPHHGVCLEQYQRDSRGVQIEPPLAKRQVAYRRDVSDDQERASLPVAGSRSRRERARYPSVAPTQQASGVCDGLSLLVRPSGSLLPTVLSRSTSVRGGIGLPCPPIGKRCRKDSRPGRRSRLQPWPLEGSREVSLLSLALVLHQSK